jgi:hypothetical protein
MSRQLDNYTGLLGRKDSMIRPEGVRAELIQGSACSTAR